MQIKNRQRRFRRPSGGSAHHIRYGHQIRPSIIDVVCPRCQKYAIATDHITFPHLFCSDLSPAWSGTPFDVVCQSCHYRAQQLSYAALPSPFHQISVLGCTLWAWNTTHLHMIYLSLKGEDIRTHPYAPLVTYIDGAWKKRAKPLSERISKYLLDFPKS